MAFTYTPEAPDDVTRVRFAIGDTDADAVIFSDGEIAMAIEEAGGWRGAVLSCLRGIIAKISAKPDMTADWLRVDYGRSLAGYQALLAAKEREYGGGRIVGGRVRMRRDD